MGQNRNSDGSITVWGNAVKDASYARVGDKATPQARFSLAWKESFQGDPHYCDCKAWRGNAGPCSKIRKGDYVCVTGRLVDSKTLKRDGTPFRDLDVDFIVAHYAPSYEDANEDRVAGYTPGAAGDFPMLPDDDSELPF